ncbi:beta-lactamase family protein [Antribacter sp. KLBMP9083]|uniref:Beta-lactamase family protein n=1 Tax=Antribacter soli TaxID=2910976 RepID=A0AA41QBQ3_9MICO|nr:serine hydrolase domain-containing protein [Antribacter soli]MCF4120202.1 beta-lactamase family protein [Antribacter soli]
MAGPVLAGGRLGGPGQGTPLAPATVDALAAHLDGMRRGARVPALSAAVGRAGRVAWAAVSGGPTPELSFRIGSITKPMVAVAVLRLVEAGRVALSDPVGRHLPDAPVPGATLRHLLSHTSGLPAEPAGPWWERHGYGSWADLVAADLPALWEPGDRYHYSNVGFAVLGRLVEELLGRPWDEVLREELWEPLGMRSTGRVPAGPAAAGFAVHPHADLVHAEPVAPYGAMGPAGEVWSTPSDLVRFGLWLVGAGPVDLAPAVADAVLSVATRRSMAVPRVVVDDAGPAGGPWTTAHGLGARVRQDGALRTVGHSGSVPGFTADLRADVVTGDVVAVCGSSTGGFGDGAGLLAVLQEHEAPQPLPVPGPGTDPALAAELTGTWYWGPSPYTLSFDSGGRIVLRSQSETGRGSVFDRVTGAGWVGVEGGYWLGERLRQDVRDGRTAALDVGTFHLTRSPYDPATRVPGGLDGTGWRALPSAP